MKVLYTAELVRELRAARQWYNRRAPGLGERLVDLVMELDRIAPSKRSSCRTRQTGQQSWKDLLFLHWEVSQDALRKLVPSSLYIDTFEGRAFLGLVPFTMHDVRFGLLSVADFLETNLRTYVHADGVPGVWFFSLDAQIRLAVWGGRMVYRLPYFRATMEYATAHRSCVYKAQRLDTGETSLDLQWVPQDVEHHAAQAGTLEHFLTERYALYGPAGNQRVYRVRVHHPPWPLRAARLQRLRTTIPVAAQIDVGEPIDLVLASPDGVRVDTFARERVRG